jgi:hypothetical protein
MKDETEMETWDREFADLASPVRRRRKLGRKGGLVLGVLLLCAGIVAATTVLLLSNTSKNTATIVSLTGDWTATGTLGASYYAGQSTPTGDTNVNTCSSGVCVNYLRNTNRNYADAGFAQVDFVILFSNWTSSDFSAFGGLWLPSNDACTPGTYTSPVQPLISGYGCLKSYNAANFASLPAQGALGQWEITFTVSSGTMKASMEMFGFVQGVTA